MATGVGTGFDLEGLDKAIKNADKGIENLIKNGQRMEQALTQNFRNVAEQGVGALVSKMDSVNGLLANLGKQKSGKLQIETSTAKAVENAVRFSELMSKINNDGASSRTNSAVYKINEELEAAKRRLAELNKLLNFYAKGEGKSAIGFVDTSSTQQEARALMNRIDLLEREKASLQANARLRMEISQMRDNRQNTIDANYAEMAKRAAKAESRIYEERDAKREQAQREYDAMGRKMRQQTNLDLAREYELQEAQNKRNEGSLKQQMEAQRKFAEERVKLEETLAAKTKNDEHKRLQKEWQDQLKARDEAEKAYIKAEEQRQKEKNKQEVNNAVATVNNLDKMHEQQHRKELQRIKDDAVRQQEKEKAEAELNKKRLAWVKQVDEEEKRKHQNELDRINKRFDAMRKREENQRREEQAKLNSTQGSLASYNQLYSPQGVRSLNQMKTVLKQLETAQANINRATKEGQRDWKQVGDAIKRVKGDIERTEKEMGKFHSRQKGILDTSGQLARAMAAIFSVSAIKGYVNKLIQIRGEFEMQQRSLQVLLQNKDEANALWDKTVALAVKSPYTTKQLVTAIKQLAAYRIESEKLYETNRMLADVSIGLGVDMNRLILAFGQVKAANFLRGTELRQFSEAGVNMLDELAKRFTALEGRAVSVGEVFERVSKRMVSFADVEAVFKTITSEGGTFYQMQEKQSDTLMGMMLNLKDSYELMLNDIGKAHEGRLKDSISTIKSLVDNWEYWGGIVMPLLEAFMARLIAIKGVDAFGLLTSGLENFRYQMALAGGGVKGFTKALKAVKTSTLIGWLFVLVGALVATANAFSEGADKAGKYAEKLAEFQGDTEDLVQEFKELTATLNDNTKSVEEQDKAYSRIVHTYGDYLSAQDIERENLKNLSGNYDELISKIERYRKIQEKETMFGFVRTEYAPDSEQMRDVFKVAEQMDKNFSAIKAQKVFQEVAKKLEEGDEFKNTKQAFDYFLKESGLKEAFKKINFDLTSDKRFADNLTNFVGSWEALKGMLGTDAWLNPKDILTFDASLVDYFNKLMQVHNEYQGLSDESKRMVEENIAEIEKHTVKSAPMFSEYNKFQKLMDYNPFFVGQEDDIERATTAWNKYVKNMTDKWIPQIWNALQQDPDVDLTPDLTKLYKEGTEESGAAYYKRLEGYLNAANETIKLYEKNTNRIKYVTEQEYKEAVNMKKALAALGVVDDKNNTRRSNPELERLKKQIQLIKELADAYKKMYDERGKEYADANIMDVNRIAAFTEAELDYSLFKYGTPKDEVDNYELLKKAAEGVAGGLLEIARAAAEANTEIGNFEQQMADAKLDRQLQSLFGNYELSLELEKLNIPPDLAKKLFGIDAIDLTQLRQQILNTYSLGDLSGLSNEDILTHERYIALNKERRDALADALEQENDMEREAQEERLKKYIAFSRKAMSERAKIKFEELQTIVEIEKAFAIKENDSEEVKATKRAEEAKAKARARKEADAAIQKLDWEAFKSSDTFNLIFDDLDNASDKVLEKVIQQLKDFKAQWKDMPFDQMRQVVDLLQKAEGALGDDGNPFARAKRFKEAIKEDGRSAEQAQLDVYNAEERKKAAEAALANYEIFKKVDEKLYDSASMSTEQQKEYVEWQKLSVEQQKDLVEEKQDEVSYQDATIQKGKKQLNNIQALKAAYDEQANIIKEINGLAQSLYSSFKSIYEALGGDGDSINMIFADMAMAMLDGVVQATTMWSQFQALKLAAAEFGFTLNSALGVIGLAVQAISMLAMAFTAFSKAHDKSKEKQIEKEMSLVKHLQRIYEDLGETIKNVYAIDTLNEATRLSKENLIAQINATERMIAAEEGKKKTDQSRIEDWKSEIEDYKKAIQELEETRLQELGAFASDENKKSGAEAFLDAWMEAYKQTGDGLSGLNEQFDEFFEDMVKKQMLQRGANKFLEPFFKQFDSAIDKWSTGGITDRGMLDEINEAQEYYLPQLNKFLTSLAETLGVSEEIAGSTAELGGLSVGISGITEDQADILAAYWSSVRLYTSDTNAKVTELVTKLFSDDTTANPMLSQLKAILAQTTAIRDLFDSVVGHGNGGTHSGAYLKVAVG